VLLPLQPLLVTYTLWRRHADIHTLKGAEWVGGHVMPTGDALLSGMYLNELLLRLLARDDPAPGAVRCLRGRGAGAGQRAWRCPGAGAAQFELLLLREIGLLPSAGCPDHDLAPLSRDTRYTWCPRAACAAPTATVPACSGSQWQALQRALDGVRQLHRHLARLRPVAAELKPQLRALLQYHCGSPLLRTRQLMIDLQALMNSPR
jgi:DNA repair protein RecO (recombination protein O)